MKLGTLEVHNTRNLITPDMRICAMLVTRPKVGKTTLAAGLHEITLKYRGKPTLIIASERAEGGGAMSVADLGIDYVMPQNITEFESLLAQLRTDKTYGGILLDNGTDYIHNIVKPNALSYPSRESGGTRPAGVPNRGDYQTMGEIARRHFNALINLTNTGVGPDFRKDLIVTALEREQINQSNSLVEKVLPDLPGALAQAAAAMFQSVVSYRIAERVVPQGDGKTRRISGRVLQSEDPSGVRVVGDRSKLWQDGYRFTRDDGSAVPLIELYETWLKRFEGVKT